MTFQNKCICDVCGKNKGRYVDHKECSKIRQSRGNFWKSKKPTVMTEKRISQFLKSLGE